MVRKSLACAVSLGLALVVAAPASAQTKRGSGQTPAQNQNQNQGPTETTRGELAGVTVVGETLVDHNTGRGAIAEFTYLTILGSPAGGRDGSRSGGRRAVYLIAVGPDTVVRDRSEQGQGRRGSDDRPDAQDQRRSEREQSQSVLERLEQGDRVEVEFNRLQRPDQAGSGNQARHGRHRIVRGVAKTLTILATPDRGDLERGSDRRRSGDSSSDNERARDKDSKKDR